jgi:hypothetical protein
MIAIWIRTNTRSIQHNRITRRNRPTINRLNSRSHGRHRNHSPTGASNPMARKKRRTADSTGTMGKMVMGSSRLRRSPAIRCSRHLNKLIKIRSLSHSRISFQRAMLRCLSRRTRTATQTNPALLPMTPILIRRSVSATQETALLGWQDISL